LIQEDAVLKFQVEFVSADRSWALYPDKDCAHLVPAVLRVASLIAIDIDHLSPFEVDTDLFNGVGVFTLLSIVVGPRIPRLGVRGGV
jgi:hypothetical protein